MSKPDDDVAPANFDEGSDDEEMEEVEVVEEVEEVEEEEVSNGFDQSLGAGGVASSMSPQAGARFQARPSSTPDMSPQSPHAAKQVVVPDGSILQQSAFIREEYSEEDDEDKLSIDDDDLESNGDTSDNDGDDDDKLLVIEESEMDYGDDSDSEFVATERKVMRRRQTVAHNETYDQWREAPTKYKFRAFLDPTAVGFDMPPSTLFKARLFGSVQCVCCIAHCIALCLLSLRDVPETIPQALFYLTTAVHAVDFGLRLAARLAFQTYLLDALVLISSIYVIVDGPFASDFFVHFALLRGVFAIRIVVLLDEFETFRDIYLIFKTIIESIQSLFVFICIFLIGLLLFATFVYVLEIDTFNRDEGVWYRQCKDFGGCETEPSPFQSIPDALWLIMSAMTTVGYGDVVPSTTPGRVVTGLAIIGGVFVISFPTMILVGNLWLTRKQYFKLEDWKARTKEERQIAKIEEDRRKEQIAALNLKGTTDFEEMGLGTQTAFSLPAEALAAESATEQGAGIAGRMQMSALYSPGSKALPMGTTSMLVGDFAYPMIDRMNRRATFSFMGKEEREVRLTQSAEYHYVPIMEVVVDGDGNPIVSSVVIRGETKVSFSILLVVDCPEAQETAEVAIGNPEIGTIARAAPVCGLEIVPKSSHPSIKLVRRTDIGELKSDIIPVHFVTDIPSEHTPESYLPRLVQEMKSMSFTVRYSPQSSSAGTWRKTFFVTNKMLKGSPFINQLRVIAVHVPPSILAMQTGSESKQMQNEENSTLVNLAFIAFRHLRVLLEPVLDHMVDELTTIRNRSQLIDSLTECVEMHSREIRFHDVPPMLHSAVYAIDDLQPFEKLICVDVDFFRLTTWPLGVVMGELSDKVLHVERTVQIGAGSGFGQPQISGPTQKVFSMFSTQEASTLNATEMLSQIHQGNGSGPSNGSATNGHHPNQVHRESNGATTTIPPDATDEFDLREESMIDGSGSASARKKKLSTVEEWDI